MITCARVTGSINADLTIGVECDQGRSPSRPTLVSAILESNFMARGFIVTPEEARSLGLGRIAGPRKTHPRLPKRQGHQSAIRGRRW